MPPPEVNRVKVDFFLKKESTLHNPIKKSVNFKELTFRQREPMRDHIWGVRGWQNCCCEVHNGLHLQGKQR